MSAHGSRGVFVKQQPKGVPPGSPLATCKPSFFARALPAGRLAGGAAGGSLATIPGRDAGAGSSAKEPSSGCAAGAVSCTSSSPALRHC